MTPKRDNTGRFLPNASAPSESSTIYAVSGMTEYLAMIPAGSVSIPLHFTGGTLTGYGIRPATAEVSDPCFKKYIEMSPLFRSGKITRL